LVNRGGGMGSDGSFIDRTPLRLEQAWLSSASASPCPERG
jgi:hypothetical protein